MVIEPCLSKTRVRGFEFGNGTLVGGATWLSSTARQGCGYRCDGIASVSTVQRYYASSYGRFNTPDHMSGNGMDPGSLNLYSYVGGDPINRSDPKGLCAVMIGGITMGPDDSSAGWTLEAGTLGADVAYPYAGENGLVSVASVAGQSIAPNGSTAAALSAIQYALSSNSGLIDIVAYSGGAAAFTAAYALLTSDQQSRIGLVQYISPGAAGAITNVQGTTSVLLGSGGVDNLATAATQIPQGVPIQNSSCDHTDVACLFQFAPLMSAIQADGQCQNPESFSLSQPPLLSALLNMLKSGNDNPVSFGRWWSLPQTITFSSQSPFEVVTSTITYQ